ncbi:GrpB family protein [Vibrio sp. SCSIO 43137]|uniref:GrpB family protein n=1 Tax=Vibrio sp. SCSIO 43137 TaxID=3021011 RepID=UPI002307BA3F|nr:GrpB family protein [Vibrio sp. SCSIO 43137]WCE32531.1 GrpB family protein [Vibrio sp. SCSIO 43137]
MSTRIIEVVDYRPSWVDEFNKEKELLQSALNVTNVVEIHHIGSTSVKDLCAKPIIDILIEVQSLEQLDRDNYLMQTLGYEVKGEFGIAGRRYFQKGGVQRSHQVHAFLVGSAEVTRHIAFRDYLIEFPDIASMYGSLKREGALVCDNDIELYCKHKESFIKEHQESALCWKYTL